MPDDGIYTHDEAVCLSLLADAWNTYIKLPKEHPNEVGQFHAAMNTLQDILAARIARRVAPELFGPDGVKVTPHRLITTDPSDPAVSPPWQGSEDRCRICCDELSLGEEDACRNCATHLYGIRQARGRKDEDERIIKLTERLRRRRAQGLEKWSAIQERKRS